MNTTVGEQAWGSTAVTLVSADGPADLVLRELIRWLDRTVPDDQDLSGPRWQALTLTHLAVGRALVAQGRATDPVVATVEAAASYVGAPTVDAYLHYATTATNSYPFGAGDGCYAVTGSPDCGPGTGCHTGAGSLESSAFALGGAARLLQVLRTDVAPLLSPPSPGARRARAGRDRR